MIYVIVSLVLILLLSIQTTFLKVFSLGGVTPDLILIVVVYCGIHFQKNSGIGLAVLVGFFQDGRKKPDNYRLEKQVTLIMPNIDGHQGQRKYYYTGKKAEEMFGSPIRHGLKGNFF